jgi:AcrR family transcriptional regulator
MTGRTDKRETTERLLDAAERLFAQHGYDGVGMRMLADEARVNLGAATYHYGSKKTLFIETFMRRFRLANAERLRLLREAEAEANGKPLTAEKIVDCMVRPLHLLGLEHPSFHSLLARNLFMPPPFLHAALHREIEPADRVFVAALHRSLPKIPEDLLRQRIMFTMGALVMFSVQMGKLKAPRNPKLDDSLIKEMARFVAAGLQSDPAVRAEDRPPFPPLPRPVRR